MRRRSESGFAMLLVFLMAAAIAIALYLEIPRVAFESQRQKEQLLIERGEQYKRAIQLFVRGNNRWPGKIEDLESSGNRRYLRRRYVDPLTGKDEWRLIHIQNGVLTDSALNKQKPGEQKEASSNTGQYVGEQAGVGAALNPSQPIMNARDRRRPNEGGVLPVMIGPDGQPAQGSTPGQVQTGGIALLPGSQPYPGGQPYPGAQPGSGGVPNAIVGGMPYPGAPLPPGAAGQPYPGQVPGQGGVLQQGSFAAGQPFPGGQIYVGSTQSYVGSNQQYVGGGVITGSQPNALAGQPVYPGQPFPGMPGPPVNSQTGGVSAQPYPTQPGSNFPSPNFPQPGMQTGASGSNAAAEMINRILTTPRPGGMPQANLANQTIGGGIAGVASNADGEGIMVYNDRSLFKEWEFVFDPTKVKQLPNPNAAGVGMGTPPGRSGSMPSTPLNPAQNPQQGGRGGRL